MHILQSKKSRLSLGVETKTPRKTHAKKLRFGNTRVTNDEDVDIPPGTRQADPSDNSCGQAQYVTRLTECEEHRWLR